MGYKLLIIDDDVQLCELLQLMLAKMDFEVEIAHDAVTGLRKAYTLKPNAIVLDIMMPGMDGWQTCQRFREMTDVPIIMLTALGAEDEVIKGLNLGADDYLVKPVTADELGARVKALLRRVSRSDSSSTHREPILTQGNLIIDLDKYEVTVDGQRVDLSPTEFKLLSVLAKYKGRVLPHEFLLTEVWGAEYVGEIDYLRLYVSYLRRKLEKDPSNPDLIQNEWGVGYRFG
ncbi:MAG TPA: response regulator transcription factor [Anaerolineae bacterium]|nr:response regulator transcription factor [Anaerolineae bacterium]HMR62642.1 response regulator transcription factor [Anaerolineae bacterium]